VDKIQKAMRGEKITGDDDDDENDSDDNIEVFDGAVGLKSRATGSATASAGASSHNSAPSAAQGSQQPASSGRAKTPTKKKVVKTYGGKKQQARNIKNTGDEEGRIFDSTTIEMDDDDEQTDRPAEPRTDADNEDNDETVDETVAPRTAAKGKQKATAKGKKKQMVMVVDKNEEDDIETDSSLPPPPPRKERPKPRPKVKATAKEISRVSMAATERMLLDEEGSVSRVSGTRTSSPNVASVGSSKSKNLKTHTATGKPSTATDADALHENTGSQKEPPVDKSNDDAEDESTQDQPGSFGTLDLCTYHLLLEH
jgi:hypothetical protein